MLWTVAMVVIGGVGLGALGCGVAWSSLTLASLGGAGVLTAAACLIGRGMRAFLNWFVSKTT